ncbi:Ig-like domain-containing protein [Flagellimonas okinawensis]|uniref:Ig-like domain-containing protein n=1 Tax=Flagellimonas okinawensis TaxID=3031324 RepID=A0ABT5XS42_9FLAO|nr:Ig-like domain-containing protein [[Muricauda] okinawensis]MDF0708719.1 Ig-like domain-containing protein [[Muricauda] okinawensis]
MKLPKLTIVALTSLIVLFSCSSDSENPVPEPEPDVVAPEVDFTIPGSTGGTTSQPPVFSNQIVVDIDATDAGGVAKVEAFLNNEKVGEDTTAPYQITIDISNYASKNNLTGKFTDYTLKITVTDTSGNESSKEEIIHIDNELPAITEVSLTEGQAIAGDSNSITFSVSDNEGLSVIKTFLNNTLLEEITEEVYEVNINTLGLTDGENTFRIEAIDLADNTATYEVVFISDNTGPEINLNTELNKVYDPISITSDISDSYSTVQSVEFLIGEQSLALFENGATPTYDFIPDNFTVGANILRIVAMDELSNISTFETPFDIERKLITINIPEDRIHPAIVTPIVFISKMDGTLVTYKEMSRDDRQIVLSSPEEFTNTDEFMLTFYLQDNGGMTGISTHQNLTRNNPGVINLPEPKRFNAGNSYEYPAINFNAGDYTIGKGGAYLLSTANYDSSLITAEGYISLAASSIGDQTKDFDSFYFYQTYQSNVPEGYSYLIVDRPIDSNFVLDKNDFITDGVETRNLVVEAPGSLVDQYSNLIINGFKSQQDADNKLFHQIYHSTFIGGTGIANNYQLNTSFYSYNHHLLFGKYYTQRKGLPLANYTIPNLTLNYSNNNSIVEVSIQGDEHILGRMQCIDFDNLNYDWYITFNSKTSTNVVIPELPEVINHFVKEAQQSNSIKVESVELLSYESILTYEDYINQVVKDQKNVLDVTDWYQLIFASRTGNFNSPNREFIFQ